MPTPHLLSLEEALDLILTDVLPLRAEALALPEALGRVLADDVGALLTLPPWDNSAMDGYAVRSQRCRRAPAPRRRCACGHRRGGGRA